MECYATTLCSEKRPTFVGLLGMTIALLICDYVVVYNIFAIDSQIEYRYSNYSHLHDFLNTSSNRVKQPVENNTETVQLFHNSINVTFLINNIGVCDNGTYILFVVYSAPSHLEARNAIRQTWGASQTRYGKSVKTIFILGASPSHQENITRENDVYNDIIQASFGDSYQNVSYKIALYLKWTARYCSGVKFVVKADDDVFIDVYQVVGLLEELRVSPFRDNVLLCYVLANAKPYRNKNSKFYVSRKEFRGKTYKPYCQGWMYILSNLAVTEFNKVVDKIQFFKIDDVLTGIFADKAKTTLYSTNSIVLTNSLEKFQKPMDTWLGNEVQMLPPKIVFEVFTAEELITAWRKTQLYHLHHWKEKRTWAKNLKANVSVFSQ